MKQEAGSNYELSLSALARNHRRKRACTLNRALDRRMVATSPRWSLPGFKLGNNFISSPGSESARSFCSSLYSPMVLFSERECSTGVGNAGERTKSEEREERKK